MRTEPRHFLHSKLLCWVALDRAIGLAQAGVLGQEDEAWRQAREAIAAVILKRGFNPTIGAFTQALDDPALDASAFVIPLVGFLPPTDLRVLSTIDRSVNA